MRHRYTDTQTEREEGRTGGGRTESCEKSMSQASAPLVCPPATGCQGIVEMALAGRHRPYPIIDHDAFISHNWSTMNQTLQIRSPGPYASSVHPKSRSEMEDLEIAFASHEWGSQLPCLNDLVSILQMCKRNKHLPYAKQAHTHIQNHGLDTHQVLGSFLVTMFVECGSLYDAEQVFYKLLHQSEHSWSALIQGYVESGNYEHALALYHQMQDDCICPNSYIFQALVKGCITLKCLKRAQELHCEIVREGFEKDPFVASTLLDMYAKLGSLVEARDVFDELPIRDIVIWTSLIAGYVEHGFNEEALNCLWSMKFDGFSPNTVTFVCSLKGCCSLGTSDRGHEVHSEIVKEGLEKDLVIGNTLVDMYSKCGSLREAWAVFNSLSVRDVISWTALITGYTEHGHAREALQCLEQMQSKGVFPNDITYICSLKACGSAGVIDIGQDIHTEIVKSGSEGDLLIGNALVDMYTKCGWLTEAYDIFNKMPVRDVVSWSSLLAGHARLGEVQLVCLLFEQMLKEGIQPDGIAFLTVLSSCSHAGLVEKGQEYFEAMGQEQGITLTLEHHNCMVDLLGRAGQLNEALKILEKMPFIPDFVTWSTLLGACQKWNNIELARQAFDRAVSLDKEQATIYIVMSNMYVDAQMWEDAMKIDAMRARMLSGIELGKSSIEIGGHVHSFMPGDTKHPESKKIYAKLEQLMLMNGEKHAFNFLNKANTGLFDVHSEMLAIAYGLISTSEGTCINVITNNCLGVECHSLMAFISTVEKRTIICRDGSCFHVFQAGKCSCENHW